MDTFYKELEDIIFDEMTMIYEDTSFSHSIGEIRFFALSDLCNVMKRYCSYGFTNQLLIPICIKKIDFIKKAVSKAEIKRILSFEKPVYYGNQFVGSTYHIPEEELMMLSLTSLEAPLTERGYKRMEELFALWYGKKIEEAERDIRNNLRKGTEYSIIKKEE
ncbi:MAG TPA: hypothetical protein IAB62_05095 [Candidatus Coprocola pullicola]|nr:hypothetical protein [Candidatus Coprocola pullicola]